MSTRKLQDAKAQFGRLADHTRREGPEGLTSFFAKSPLAGLGIEQLERDRDPGRDHAL